MAHNKKKHAQYEKDIVKAIHLASRQDQFERNGGGQWVAVNRPHKNKKKYDRKQNKKEIRNISPYFFGDNIELDPKE